MINIIFMSFCSACLSFFLEMNFQKGMIFRKYYAIIKYWLYLRNNLKWLYKPLGGCIYCFSTWVFIVLFLIRYIDYPNGTLVFVGLLQGIGLNYIFIKILEKL